MGSFCIDQHYSYCFIHSMYSLYGYCSFMQYATGLKVYYVIAEIKIGEKHRKQNALLRELINCNALKIF